MELIVAFLIGVVVGTMMRTKDTNQSDAHDKLIAKYQEEIAYYKSLCKWHVERSKK